MLKPSFAILAALLLVPFAVACSSTDDSATGDDQNITTTREGGMCGGFANIRCGGGLRCAMGPAGNTADEGGTCVQQNAEHVTMEGTMRGVMGIGGETTGRALYSDHGSVELILSSGLRDAFVEGGLARVTGTKVGLSGVETHNRPALVVDAILTCPAEAHPVIDCEPPTTNPMCSGDSRDWIQAHCPGVTLAM